MKVRNRVSGKHRSLVITFVALEYEQFGVVANFPGEKLVVRVTPTGRIRNDHWVLPTDATREAFNHAARVVAARARSDVNFPSWNYSGRDYELSEFPQLQSDMVPVEA